MDTTSKKINHPSVQNDLYKSVKFIRDFKEEGIKKGDVGVIVYASSSPDMFEVQVRPNDMPITVPGNGLELIKPKT